MVTFNSVLKQLRKICLALPDTTESEKWGEPHFCVCKKIFCGAGKKDGVFTIGFKLQKTRAATTVQLPGFSVAPYVGKHGWVTLDVEFIDDWEDVAEMIMESYQLIAPRRTLNKLDQ